jgi:hypothetical protein
MTGVKKIYSVFERKPDPGARGRIKRPRQNEKLKPRVLQSEPKRPSSLLKNLEMESFLVLADRCWGGAVELDVIF